MTPTGQMLSGRAERRLATSRPAKLEAADEPSISETVEFANISEHGARIIADRRWDAGRPVIVSDSMSSFRANAAVVYCAPHVSRRFAVGLRFSEHRQDIHLLVAG
jgi:hypothetical protein